MPAPSQQRQVVTVRIPTAHVAELRRIADQNASTVSRIVARAVANDLERRANTANDRHTATSAQPR